MPDCWGDADTIKPKIIPNMIRLFKLTSCLPLPSPQKQTLAKWPAFGERRTALEHRLEVDSQTELHLAGRTSCKNAGTQT
jgi:hypothetical protein